MFTCKLVFNLQRQHYLIALKAAVPFTGELQFITAESSPIISDFKKLLHYFLQGGVWGSAMTLTR